MPAHKINEIGNRYGKLTVISEAPYKKNKKIVWTCKCDCSNTIDVVGTILRSGKKLSCGCSNGKIKNEIGNKYGRLIVIEYDEELSKIHTKAYWKCKCECGNIISVVGTDLRNGHTKSCGCLQKEVARNNQIINEIGNVYGKLTVIDYAQSKNNEAYWKCKCECGNICEVSGRNLRCGYTKSCGCLTSYGEERIIKFLINNNYNFEKEYTFNDLKGIDNKTPLRFDFCIHLQNKNILIEFDGEQHFYPSGWEGSFERTQYNDKIKNEYCITHNIELHRIPYTDIDNIETILTNILS